MADEDLRALERRAKEGDIDAMEELAAAYIRLGQPERIYFMVTDDMKRRVETHTIEELRDEWKKPSVHPRLEALWDVASNAVDERIARDVGCYPAMMKSLAFLKRCDAIFSEVRKVVPCQAPPDGAGQ